MLASVVRQIYASKLTELARLSIQSLQRLKLVKNKPVTVSKLIIVVVVGSFTLFEFIIKKIYSTTP